MTSLNITELKPVGEKDAEDAKIPEVEKPAQPHFCAKVLNSCIIEVFAFFMLAGVSIRPVTLLDLLKERVCLWTLELPEVSCSNLSSFNISTREDIIRISNNYNMFSTLIATSPGVIIAIFVGPWSQNYGRRIPVFLAVTGETLRSMGYLWISLTPESPAYYVLLASIPGGIFGSWACIFTCVFSQISASTNRNNRTIKLFFLELALGFGVALATLTGGQLYYHFGYNAVFAASSGLLLISSIMGVMAMDKSTNTEEWKSKAKAFFAVESIRRNLKVGVKKRNNSGRLKVWLFLLSLCLHRMNELVIVPVGYPFANTVFGWDNKEYSNYTTILQISTFALMTPAVLFLTKCLHFGDFAMSVVGSISAASKSIVMGLQKEFLYFTAFAIGIYGKSSIAGIRALTSRLVEKEELGSLFAFQAALESVVPLCSAALFTQIFNASIDFYPGLALQVAGAMALVPLVVLMFASKFKMEPRENVEVLKFTPLL